MDTITTLLIDGTITQIAVEGIAQVGGLEERLNDIIDLIPTEEIDMTISTITSNEIDRLFN